jgi:hypothetical protein
VLEKAILRVQLKVEQFFDGAGFGIGIREQVFCGEFVFPEVLLDAKWFDLHAEESGKQSGPASSAKLSVNDHDPLWVDRAGAILNHGGV